MMQFSKNFERDKRKVIPMLHKRQFECLCGGHLITIERFEDDKEVTIGFWEQTFYSLQASYRIRHYFKRLWSAICGKNWMLYDIILSREDTERLRQSLFLANINADEAKNVQDK